MHTQDRPNETTHLVGRTGLGTGLAVLAFLAMLMSGFSQPVGAQVDPASCGHFEFQEDAQVALEQNPELAVSLDNDGNGIACETLPSKTGGPVVVDPASCGHYETQADAQADLDAHPEFASSLDGNGNGIACDEFQTGGPVVVDPASCGHFEFQEDAQVALEQNPELALSLDNDGNGIACEILPSKTTGGTPPETTTGGTAPETTVGTTPTSTGNETVIALPNTGVGFSQRGNAPLWLLPVAGLVVAFGGLLSWSRHSRRLSNSSI